MDLPLTVNAVALGDSDGTSKISVRGNDHFGWNTMVPGFMNEDSVQEEIETPVKRLDDYLLSRGIQAVRLIKIDTEGYELPVLNGLKGFLDRTKHLPILIVEVAPTAYPKLGRSLTELAEYVAHYGYVARDVITEKKLSVDGLKALSNIVFLHPDFH